MEHNKFLILCDTIKMALVFPTFLYRYIINNRDNACNIRMPIIQERTYPNICTHSLCYRAAGFRFSFPLISCNCRQMNEVEYLLFLKRTNNTRYVWVSVAHRPQKFLCKLFSLTHLSDMIKSG